MPIHLDITLDLSDPSLSKEDREIGESLTEEMKGFIKGLVGLDGIEAISGVPRWYIKSFADSVKRNPDDSLAPLLVEFGVWLGARQFFRKVS